MDFDLLLRGGLAVDGTGSEAFPADVGVRADRIEAIGPALGGDAARVVDATGLVVAPGFIDIHAHGDIYPLLCPEASARLHDGVTTEIVGNCGDSAFPQSNEMLAERARSAERYGIAVDWRTLDDLAARQDAVGSAISRGSLVGAATVRRAVFGERDRAPTPDELAAMRREVEKAMDAGAFGLSSGLIYAPGMYAQPPELEALAEVAARYGGFYASHIRSEGEAVEEAVEEFIAAGRRTGVRLEYSHVKAAGEANWHRADRLIELIERARAEGIDLACDRYPYTAAATGLTSLLPGWSREGSTERMLERLADPADRPRILDALADVRASEASWDAVVVASVRSEKWQRAEGRSILEIAREAGLPPTEMALDLLLASGGAVSIILFSMSEENLLKWLRLPYVALGSDGGTRSIEGPTATGKPHPRSYGFACRFLGRYVRDQRLVPLAEGVRRLTGLPASRIGLARRGVLRPGAFADITVFDPVRIEDRATFEHPQQYSFGVRHVVVNGVLAMADGQLTGSRSGRFLRRGSE